MSQTELIHAFEEAVYHAESIVPNMNVVAKFLLNQKAKELGFRIALTGEGADESLLGYDFFRKDIEAPNLNQQDKYEHFIGQADFEAGLRFSPQATLSTQKTAYILSTLRDERFNELIIHKTLKAPDLSKVNSQLGYSQWLHYNTVYQEYNLLALGDKVELAHGIEGRQPFLDNDVINFLHSLPISYKYNVNKNKLILRDLHEQKYPELTVNKVKKPFIAPANNFYQIYYLLIEKLCKLKTTSSTLGIYNIDKVICLVTNLGSSGKLLDFSNDVIFCHLLSIACLQERFSLEVQ